ncbi:MAG: CoA transferase [Chloroflexi bacterium]|nr:CoA transferase [Chloroflexota bacterium]
MPGPLEGIRVVDLTRILAGPYCTMILADLGADVVKVEQPGGDQARRNGPFFTGSDGQPRSTYFTSVNRGKRSIVIDLKNPAGRDAFLRLVDGADVVTENFRPGTMTNLGVDYATLSARNPRLIMASVSGFGQDGPFAKRAALDVIVQAMGGMLSITGEEGGGPVRPGVSMGDITAALFTTIGVLSAVVERGRSGLGQHIDMAMLDCQAAILENPLMRYFALGEMPERIGTRHPVTAPVQALPTKDGYVAVAVSDGPTGHWGRFATLIGKPELKDDERFASGWLRRVNYDELRPHLESALAQRTTGDWVDLLGPAGIAVGPVQDVSQVAVDPQLNFRGMFVEAEAPQAGAVTFTNTPVKHSRTPGGVRRGAPEPGEHTDAVLAEAGIGAEEAAALRACGAVG